MNKKNKNKTIVPLAEQLRPTTFDQIVGQEHIFEETGLLASSLRANIPQSLLFWGPAGCGKTSIVKIYAQKFSLPFHSLCGSLHNVSHLKTIIQKFEQEQQTQMIFIDEIHRFNRAQQDILLPFLENGSFILLGATTENPSFYLNSALLSRVQVLRLHCLREIDLAKILERFEKEKKPLCLSKEVKDYVFQVASGDGRFFLNLLDVIQKIPKEKCTSIETIQKVISTKLPLYDHNKDQHYFLISSLHKAVRGSDPDAALYWFSRMMAGGENPLYIIRRLIRIATEDVGLADPQALPLAISALHAYEHIGSPEGDLAIAQVVIYLALAPKSNSLYKAHQASSQVAQKTSHLSPPLHILNASTKLMKKLNFGKDYQYDHNTLHGFSGQNYFPPDMKPQQFYHPVEKGYEREMKKRMQYFEALKKKITSS